jgi:hypothetical protein
MQKKLTKRDTEWFETYELSIQRTLELQKQGWKVSCGRMRRAGKEFYVRSWKWEKLAASVEVEQSASRP